MEVKRLGGLWDNEDSVRQAGGVFSVEEICPSLTAVMANWNILILVEESNEADIQN